MKYQSLAGQLRNAEPDGAYSFHGRVSSVRDHRKIVFMDIFDSTGSLQAVASADREGESVAEQMADCPPGSYVRVHGMLREGRGGQQEVHVSDLEIMARSTGVIDPKPWKMDGTEHRHGAQVFGHTSMYLSNPQRAAVLRFKSHFVRRFHEYFDERGFVQVEPPIITDKPLYDTETAVTASVHGEDVYLSQCATFELEPLALAFGKVYTISPAFRNEKGGSKRHLAEYTHAKAEILLADMEDLMELAGESIFESVARAVEDGREELRLLGVDVDLDLLHPSSFERMSYDDAIRIARRKGSDTPIGHGLTHRDEQLITEQAGGKYVWVHHPPAETEGFPYRRNPENRDQAMVSDLIAPHGSGEMVGIAEKVTSAEELVENLIAKGKKADIHRYWEYITLRRFGLPPHGGMGAAPERIVYGILDLDHIRLTKPWPRYPGRKITALEDLDTFGDDFLEELIERFELSNRNEP